MQPPPETRLGVSVWVLSNGCLASPVKPPASSVLVENGNLGSHTCNLAACIHFWGRRHQKSSRANEFQIWARRFPHSAGRFPSLRLDRAFKPPIGEHPSGDIQKEGHSLCGIHLIGVPHGMFSDDVVADLHEPPANVSMDGGASSEASIEGDG